MNEKKKFHDWRLINQSSGENSASKQTAFLSNLIHWKSCMASLLTQPWIRTQAAKRKVCKIFIRWFKSNRILHNTLKKGKKKMTKGSMIKALKSIGIRKGDKIGATVSLEHLKTTDVINLYFKHFEK